MTTQTETVYLHDLHIEHSLWMNELKFVKEEISIFEGYLEDLTKKRQDREMLRGLEHFQNQFIRQKEVLDILAHDIKASERTLAANAKDNPEASENLEVDDHQYLFERFQQFQKLYAELKEDFRVFMANWKQ
ncbi:MAG: hypothetical protein ACE5FF_01040 [Saprospiraceae bacterium]